MENIKYKIGITFYYIHFFIGFLLTFYLLYTDNVYYIIFILCSTFLLLLFWYIFNDCIVVSFENYLLDKKNEYNDFTKYKILYILNRKHFIFDHVLYSSHTFINALVFFIAIIKLILNANKLKNKKIVFTR